MRVLPGLLIAGLLAGSPAVARAVTLEEVIGNPQLWPLEVTVTANAKGGVVNNGQVSGMMLIGAGKKLTVTGITADGVTGKLGGATVRVAVDKTDLLQRANGQLGGVPVADESASVAEAPPAVSGPLSAMHRRLSGKLVQLTGGSLQPVQDARLAGVKYYGLYFSASWCGPCRQFTPGFVEYYRKLKQEHPEFEVIFISADRSSGDMRDYMKEDRMPWPALKYDLRTRNPELTRYSGPGIPCLVLVDASGRVLADSYEGDNYLGPGQALRETERILKKNRGR